jgi:hypothetical protein
MTLQILEVSWFDEAKRNKNIAGRVTVSDGVSTMIAMMSNKMA